MLTDTNVKARAIPPSLVLGYMEGSLQATCQEVRWESYDEEFSKALGITT